MADLTPAAAAAKDAAGPQPATYDSATMYQVVLTERVVLDHLQVTFYGGRAYRIRGDELNRISDKVKSATPVGRY